MAKGFPASTEQKRKISEWWAQWRLENGRHKTGSPEYQKQSYLKHRIKILEQQRKRRAENPEVRNAKNAYHRGRNRKLKLEVIEAYGGKCCCCEENRMEFMTVDHINGDGRTHRKEVGCSTKLYFWLKKNGFPKDRFRLLCFNCNCSIGFMGYCPHERERAICPQ